MQILPDGMAVSLDGVSDETCDNFTASIQDHGEACLPNSGSSLKAKNWIMVTVCRVHVATPEGLLDAVSQMGKKFNELAAERKKNSR